MPLGRLLIQVAGSISDIKKAFAEVGKEADGLTGKLTNIGGAMTKAGKSMSLAVTAPLAGLATVAVSTAVNFESAMLKVQAVSGATGEKFDELTALAKELGATTSFSATEAAEGMQYLAMAGFEVDEILKTMPSLLSLAAATSMDLGTAADITSNIMSAFGIEAENSAHVADVLALTAASANTDVMQLGDAMKYVAPVAAGFGMSIEETAAAAGLLSDAGIQASMAGTTLRGIMSGLATPTNAATKALASYGIAIEDVNPDTHKLAEIIQTLGNAGVTTADILTIFGDRAGPGMNALLMRGADGLINLTSELENADGAAKNMADTMLSGTGGALTELKSALEGLMIEFGDLIAEAILPFIHSFKELVSYFIALPTPIKKIIILFAGIVAALGPVLIIVGMIVSAIGTIGGAFTAAGGLAGIGAALSGALGTVVTFITGPFGVAIAALAAAAYLIYKNWDIIGPMIANTMDAMWEAVEPAITMITQFVTVQFNKILEWWDENGEMIIEAATNVMNVIMFALKPIFTNVSWLLKSIASAVKTALPNILDAVSAFITVILDVITLVAQILTGDWSGAWDTALDIVENVGRLMVSSFKGTVNLLIGFLNGLIDGLNTFEVEIPDWVPDIGGMEWSMSIPKIPALANGGRITSAGSVLVGEAGPEFLNLPTGASVTPLDKAGTVFNFERMFEGATLYVQDTASVKQLAREIHNVTATKARSKGVRI